jgi:hypothetical protein
MAASAESASEAGAHIDDFLAWFPGVSRDQGEAVLQHAELT